MNKRIKELLELHRQDIERINNQRRMWLYASSGVFAAIITIIFGWDWFDNLHSKSLWWFIVSMALLLSVNWWYWTMRVVRKMMYHQEIEYDLLRCILNDLSNVKTEIHKLSSKEVEKSK